MNENTKNWRSDIYDILREQNIEQVCYVPDAGHAALIRDCEADNKMTVIGVTTEEDGVGVLTGTWLGGQRGVMLMQSSGVGNTINALAMPNVCRVPFVTIVSMRGEWGEFVPWQVPMGKATPDVLEALPCGWPLTAINRWLCCFHKN
jgi:sulfopyruvate decarboxylase alpha subunit